jgi:hypothetical protein
MRKRSKAQRQASRRNGALSRGPITAEGKAIVAHNAITHGLTAKVNLLTTEERPDLQMDRAATALNAEILNPDHATRTSLAWIAARPDLEPFHRYARQQLRDHDRAYRHLQQLRAERAETADNLGQNHDLAEIENKPKEPHVDRQ